LPHSAQWQDRLHEPRQSSSEAPPCHLLILTLSVPFLELCWAVVKYRLAKEVSDFSHQELIAQGSFLAAVHRQLAAYAAPPFDGTRVCAKVFERMLAVFRGVML